MRPDVGTQAQFKKRKPAVTYRYDSSLSPVLDWDSQNPAREQGDAALRQILEAKSLDEAKRAAEQLKALTKPFLNWAGKAERLSFEVPTLPLFVHERLSTKAIIETLSGHKRDKQQTMFELFGDPQHSFTDQVLRAYEYPDKWVNRMILGDSLVVMNSLLHYEGLGGQVQMIYMDPPYGVKFGSNFQPFVRRKPGGGSAREVVHNSDEDMTREPEMVQAYRDTWEFGLHSYLTYLRDRLLLARELLAPTGSIFVQISDQNMHLVRAMMDEVFGNEHSVVTIAFKKKSATTPTDPVNDYLLWYAKEKPSLRARQLFLRRSRPEDDPKFNTLISPSWEMKRLNDLEDDEIDGMVEGGWKWARVNYPLVSQEENDRSRDFVWNGKPFKCGRNRHWTYDPDSGMTRLATAKRLFDGGGDSLGGVVFWDDWPFVSLSNVWDDVHGEPDPIYVVQTSYKVVQRCLAMTTDPGDLVLDPTCGSGTTAYVAEQWGRRWITIDTSRVPLALARQRLLTATFPWYELKDEARGPVGGFVYKRRQNKKGEEAGGIVPHVTLESIANNELPKEEVVVDRPEESNKITRVSGPFCVEATIPTPVDLASSEGATEDSKTADFRAEQSTYVDRMLEVLRKSPILRVQGNRTVALKNVRPPAKTLSLSAEALVDATAPGQTPTLQDAVQEAAEKSGKALPLSSKPVALVFGPENGAITERLVQEAAKEASLKSYTHLYVVGFAIQPTARQLIENCDAVVGIPATYIQATPDLMMGDLLKNMRSSQIFSVCGLPEIRIRHRHLKDAKQYEVELLGLDVFDPATMDAQHRTGNDVPAWLLDTDYNGLCFHVSQAFFPRTGAWDNLKKALKGEYDETVWDHLSGTTSAPFEAGEHRQIAVKVIDDRGNELMVIEKL
jgi:adenine-specific DNA-methyltransferase